MIFLSADHWYSHRCSLLDWDMNCTNDLNLTLNYSHLYHGDRSTITASYDEGGNETLTYFICLRRYIPKLNNFLYNNIACVERPMIVLLMYHGAGHITAMLLCFLLMCSRMTIFPYLHSLVPRETSLLEVSYTFLFSNLVLENRNV